MKADRGDCLLLVIDIQERLIDTILERQRLVHSARALVKAAETLNLPILTTEQEKLGDTVPELEKALTSHQKFKKLTFNCCQNAEFMSKLRRLGRKTVVVCGIEGHICVLQTVLDLIERGYTVHVVKDAVSSRSQVDVETAIGRMRDAGAVITTTEALIYELTERAGTNEFGEILQIVKERRSTITA